jgi:curved DNA-binding protein CbpA
MQNRRNYYRLLQVQPDAPVEVIRASFRALLKDLKQHPDLGGSNSAAALLNEAYQTLSDPKRRADYDRRLLGRYTRKDLAGQPIRTEPTVTTQTRRALARTPQNAGITYWLRSDSAPGEGTMIDMSPEGMRFVCERPIEPESAIRIIGPDFRAAGAVKNCRAIEHQGKRRYSIGILFTAVDFEDTRGHFFSTSG